MADETRKGQARKTTGTGARPRVDYEARKQEFLRAAARVLLTHGASASMQVIAEGCGAQKPVFYRIFESRADLMDAFFRHVREAIERVFEGKWDGYGWALKMIYAEALKEREIFLVVLKTLRGDPELEEKRQELLEIMHARARLFFVPERGAPPGGKARAVLASQTLSNLSFDTLVVWLEGKDGLSDEARFKWWGRIIREWRKATREAFRLDPPE